MKAIVFDRHGESDVLNLREVPAPPAAPGTVAVRLKAAGVNHLDIWVRKGFPNVPLPLPHIPGSDGAGVIEETGAGVKGLKAGDRVVLSPGMGCGTCDKCRSGWESLCDGFHLIGFQIDGAYAERIVVPERRVIKVSDKYSFEEWASVPLVFVTAYHMLVTHAKLKAGETVLIHAAGSGIGSAAIQIAKHLGAQVITTVGNEAKAAKAKALGAGEVILYRKNDFAEETKRLTGGKGADVVFEHIGPETFQKSLQCLAKGGRLVTCGATSGPKIELDLRFLYMRQHTVIGSYMGDKGELAESIRLLEKGILKPVVDTVYPLADARKAHDRMDARDFFGKLVLKV